MAQGGAHQCCFFSGLMTSPLLFLQKREAHNELPTAACLTQPTVAHFSYCLQIHSEASKTQIQLLHFSESLAMSERPAGTPSWQWCNFRNISKHVEHCPEILKRKTKSWKRENHTCLTKRSDNLWKMPGSFDIKTIFLKNVPICWNNVPNLWKK